jgi:hypothetical protein
VSSTASKGSLARKLESGSLRESLTSSKQRNFSRTSMQSLNASSTKLRPGSSLDQSRASQLSVLKRSTETFGLNGSRTEIKNPLDRCSSALIQRPKQGTLENKASEVSPQGFGGPSHLNHTFNKMRVEESLNADIPMFKTVSVPK